MPGEFYSNAASFGLEPTQDSFSLIRDALRGARSIFRPGYRYWKAGVMLNELIEARTAPAQMFPSRDPVRSARLMAAMDNVNDRFGRGMVPAGRLRRRAKMDGKGRISVAALHDPPGRDCGRTGVRKVRK